MNLNIVQIDQSKFVKVHFHFNYLTPTHNIYQDRKLINITQIYQFKSCILIRKILSGDIHTQLTFTKNRKH